MRRIFFAVPLNASHVKPFLPLYQKVVRENPHVVFSPVSKWHITLHFVGDVSEKALEKIMENFKNVHLPRMHPIVLGGNPPLGRFGNSVLYLRVTDEQKSLHALHTILKGMVPVRLEQTYQPHITWGRNPKHENLQKIVGENMQTSKKEHNFGQIFLYESISNGNETRYMPLAHRRIFCSKRAKTR